MSRTFSIRIMSRLVAVVGICLFTAGAQYSCSSDGRGFIRDDDLDDSGNGPTYSTTLILRDSAGTESYTFQRGDLITFELRVRNRTNETRRLEMCIAPDREFFVFNDGTSQLRWKWTEGRAFPAVVGPLIFAAGETKVLTGEWNQVTRTGEMLTAGQYEARGVVPCAISQNDPLQSSELGSTLRNFTIG